MTASELKAIKENGSGLFFVEGRFISDIPEKYIEAVVVSDSYMRKNLGFVFDATVQVIKDTLFAQLSDTKAPQGIMAVCRKTERTADDVLDGVKSLAVLAEGINDPGNLGSILRAARACGADAVIAGKTSADIYNPKTIRAAAGSFFTVPVLHKTDLLPAIDKLKNKGIKIIAARADGEKYCFDIDLTTNCAILIGNETRGLSDEATSAADVSVQIPMPGGAESLNASAACAVLLYEVVRQRMKK